MLQYLRAHANPASVAFNVRGKALSDILTVDTKDRGSYPHGTCYQGEGSVEDADRGHQDRDSYSHTWECSLSQERSCTAGSSRAYSEAGLASQALLCVLS